MNYKHLSSYKEINNNYIIASRAYFLQRHDWFNSMLEVLSFLCQMIDYCFESLDCRHMGHACDSRGRSLKEICPRGNNKVIIYFLIS